MSPKRVALIRGFWCDLIGIDETDAHRTGVGYATVCSRLLASYFFTPQPQLRPPHRSTLSRMMSRAVLSEISNPTVRAKEDEEQVRGATKCWGVQKRKSEDFPSPLFLSRGAGQLPTLLCFTVWLREKRGRTPVAKGVTLPCPCPHVFTLPS